MREDTISLPVGRIIDGRYRVLHRLAGGAWSQVFVAEQIRTGQRVALKVLRPNLPIADHEAEDSFLREARHTARLQHPSTVRVFDVGRVHAGALYIASQLLEGPTLEAVFEDNESAGRSMTLSTLLPILEGLLGALGEAHAIGLVHRDVKPANVVLHEVEGDSYAKLLDFGVAAVMRETGDGHRIVGSPETMSPEQCAGRRLDARSDLYAVATVAFRAVAGRPVFEATTIGEMLLHHVHTPAPDLRAVMQSPPPAWFCDWVARGLAKRPSDRFPDATTMREALAGPTTVAVPYRSVSTRSIPRVELEVQEGVPTGRWRSTHDLTVGAGKLATELDRSQAGETARYRAVERSFAAPRRHLPGTYARSDVEGG